jgi:hypothetical protein
VNFIPGTIASVREISIIISDLYFAGEIGGDAAGSPAMPGLEDAARFGQKATLEAGWRGWLARSMGRDDLVRAAAAAVAAGFPAHQSGGGTSLDAISGGTVWFATPIHLIAGLTSVHLDYRGLLRLAAEDLTRLAKDFAAAFGDTDFHLEPTPSGALLLRSRSPLDVVTTDPSRALARELEASLPTGRDAAVLKRLGAEMEMWLHNHPLNEGRARRGELPVSTLWLWGGGPPLEVKGDPTPPVDHSTSGGQPTVSDQPTFRMAFGSDPYLAGLCSLNGTPLHPLPEQLPDLAQYPGVEQVALVAQITSLLQAKPRWMMFEALAHIDNGFIQPAMAALRRGAVDSVVLVANDTQLHINRRDRLKFWRRRPKSGSAALGVLRS